MKGVEKSFELVSNLVVAKWGIVTDGKDLTKFSFPYYLKADIPGHKTEEHAVLKCEDMEHAKKSLKWLHHKFPENKIVVQESIEGIEMIIGVETDEVFGKLLMIGFGGIFAEVKRDVSFRALPVTKNDVKEMLLELKGKDIFKARGKKYDLGKFIDLVYGVSIIVDKKKIKELDLNPVMVNEKKSVIVDARIELE